MSILVESLRYKLGPDVYQSPNRNIRDLRWKAYYEPTIKAGKNFHMTILPAYAARAILRSKISIKDFFTPMNEDYNRLEQWNTKHHVFSEKQIYLIDTTQCLVESLFRKMFDVDGPQVPPDGAITYLAPALTLAADDSVTSLIEDNMLAGSNRSAKDLAALKLEEKLCEVHMVDSNHVVIVLSASFFKAIAWRAVIPPVTADELSNLFPTVNTEKEISAILFKVTSTVLEKLLERNNYETTILSYLYGLHQRLLLNLSKYQ